MADRILATHVGSLVRPPKLVEFLRLIETGQPYDKAGYESCLKASIEEVVRQQVGAATGRSTSTTASAASPRARPRPRR